MSAPHMPMMNDEGLLECERCGSMKVASFAVPRARWVECLDCGKASDGYFKLIAAFNDWNTRKGYLYTADDFKQSAQERE